MAKIKAPLFSLDATGTLDKNITYKKKLQNNIAQKYSQPGANNPFESSPRQKDQRSIIRLVTIHWQCMSAGDKLSWNNAAKDNRFKGTGYHYFLSKAQQNLTQYLGLVGYWSMNYNVDDKIPDLSGNGNHGTLSPIYPCDCPQPIDSNNKKNGKALFFDGLDDYLTFGNTSLFNFTSSALTIEFLIKPKPRSSSEFIFQKGSYYLKRGYTLYLSDTGAFCFRTFQLDSNSQGSYSYFLPSDIFTFVSITRSGSSVTLYFNSIDRTVSAASHVDPSSSPDPFNVGTRYSGSYYNGIVDNFLIFNRALSLDEIKKHSEYYNSP